MVLLADGACYVHDRRSGETRRIGIRRPALDGMRGDARAVSYVARAQYRIDAWPTLPRDAGAGRLPLVVMAGDQPYGAGGGYDAWAEFLASRGYAVLRPGVRGTIGRGDAHWKGGFAMWGQRMRDDLADAAAWAVASGLAAADRICYVGRGRGGYIALIGALGDESNARCAAAFAFDIPRNTLFDYRIARHHWLWNTWLGNPARFWTDTVDPFSGERLHGEIAARSPLRTPKHGGFPVLIDSGDRRRPATFHKDSGGFRRAVQAAGRLERAFPRGSQREIDFLAALATFLDGNIGDSETRPSEASSTRRSSLPGPATRPPES